MAKFVMHQDERYQVNEYMDGLCPECRNWEAPITVKELVLLRDQSVHRGSGPRKIDPKAQYHRETWIEFFECPEKKCHTRFGVPYSST